MGDIIPIVLHTIYNSIFVIDSQKDANNHDRGEDWNTKLGLQKKKITT